MFEGWQAFYQLTGGASATLIGLLFLVVSLTSGRQVSASTLGLRLFMTPTFFHLVSVLVISGAAVAPAGEGDAQSAFITVWAGCGLVYGLFRCFGLRALSNPSHWSDFWWYGFIPTIAFAALTAAAGAAWLHAPHAVHFTALCLMALLVAAIRNAWDLVTWLAPRRDYPASDGPN
jgi:hypothetical protein